MALSGGTKLGPYEIVAPLGAGGMGEVYRARDAKLGRDVALKVLPEAFARDAECMARFQREARVLASLNHPNIAAIHGLEDSGSTHALVMELVEGPTLADRIRSSRLHIDEALRIAKQICEALEYAHDRGVVHRDLKPANAKVTNDDSVKILDFGLAKAIESKAVSTDSFDSPTISQMATKPGMLLGTPAYMSPEQAAGKTVDRRADIWAFGCVLYEMLTGEKTFRGESVADTLAAVLRAEPDWSLLPVTAPNRVRILLQRCLQKDSRQRLQSIGDARIAIDEILSGAPDPGALTEISAPLWRRALPWALASLLFIVVLPIALVYFREKSPVPVPPMRFEIPLPEATTYTSGAVSLAPNGRSFAFIATGADGTDRLWIRALDTLEMRVLEGTEEASGYPVWSPDSRRLAFSAQDKLKKIEVSGGPPVTLCDTQIAWGGTWTRDDKIVFGTVPGTMQVSGLGGPLTPITTGGNTITPSFLPDGRHFVYWAGTGGSGVDNDGIHLGSLDGKLNQQQSGKLLPDYSAIAYSASSDSSATGYLVFVRIFVRGSPFGTLMAQPFDNRRLRLTDEAVPIAERVSVTSFSVSGPNVLVYASGEQAAATAGSPGDTMGQLTWFDRQGKSLGTVGDPGVYHTLALSPDGRRLAFDRIDPQNSANSADRNIWLRDLARGVATRGTFDADWDSNPVWSPDGKHIVFASNRGGQFALYQKSSNLAGEDELLFKSGNHSYPGDWSPDGRFLLYSSGVPSQEWILPLAGAADSKPFPLAKSDFSEEAGRFSPDGRWVVYQSNESGKDEIYVRPFDASSAGANSSLGGNSGAGKWLVSNGGGTAPLWRSNGKEIFYLSADRMATVVEVSTSGGFQAGVPKALFKVPPSVLFWDASSDGKRFLIPVPSAGSTPPKFVVVLNWQAGLKK
jgi:eukaryotic-like serine/threonine-protein kinase